MFCFSNGIVFVRTVFKHSENTYVNFIIAGPLVENILFYLVLKDVSIEDTLSFKGLGSVRFVLSKLLFSKNALKWHLITFTLL